MIRYVHIVGIRELSSNPVDDRTTIITSL